MSAQNALTLAEMPVEPITRVQRERDAGALPRCLNGSGFQQRLDEGPQLPGVETTPWKTVPQPNARGSSTALPPGALLAADPPGADAAVLGRMKPADVPMADQRPHGPTERTTQKIQTCEKPFDLRLRPEEHLHPRKVYADSPRTRSKRTGLNPIEGGNSPGTALRHRPFSHIPAVPSALSIRPLTLRHYAPIAGNNT
jgi:hypothetical protein